MDDHRRRGAGLTETAISGYFRPRAEYPEQTELSHSLQTTSSTAAVVTGLSVANASRDCYTLRSGYSAKRGCDAK